MNFIGFSCGTKYYLSLDFFFFDFHHLRMQKPLLDHRPQTGSRLPMARGMEFADRWATGSKKKGRCPEALVQTSTSKRLVSKCRLRGRWSITAETEERRACRLLLSPSRPLALPPPTPTATPGSHLAVEVRWILVPPLRLGAPGTGRGTH